MRFQTYGSASHLPNPHVSPVGFAQLPVIVHSRDLLVWPYSTTFLGADTSRPLGGTSAASPEGAKRSESPRRVDLKRPDLKGTFRCSVCQKTFCHSSSLSRHRMQAHFGRRRPCTSQKADGYFAQCRQHNALPQDPDDESALPQSVSLSSGNGIPSGLPPPASAADTLNALAVHPATPPFSSIDVLRAALLSIGQQQQSENYATIAATPLPLLRLPGGNDIVVSNNNNYNYNYNIIQDEKLNNKENNNNNIMSTSYSTAPSQCHFTPISPPVASQRVDDAPIGVVEGDTDAPQTAGAFTIFPGASNPFGDVQISRECAAIDWNNNGGNARDDKNNSDNNNNNAIQDIHDNKDAVVAVVVKSLATPIAAKTDQNSDTASSAVPSCTSSLMSSISNSPIDLRNRHDALDPQLQPMPAAATPYEPNAASLTASDILVRYEQLELTNSHLRVEVAQLREYMQKCQTEAESLRHRNQLLQYRLITCREKAALVGRLTNGGRDCTVADSGGSGSDAALRHCACQHRQSSELVEEILRITSM